MAGNVLAEDVLTDMAMLSPNDALVPVLARSGEIAPFQTKSELLVAAPDWKREPASRRGCRRRCAEHPSYGRRTRSSLRRLIPPAVC